MSAIESLERRQLLSGIMIGYDSYQFSQQTEGAATPVVLDVLANDFSPSGGLTITSVESPAHGGIAIRSADPNDTLSHDSLLFVVDAAFTGTEWSRTPFPTRTAIRRRPRSR